MNTNRGADEGLPTGDWRTCFPGRQIHLDFHIGPDIPDVGSGFDADQFARTFRDADVESVTLFAKCHHGMLYFRTERPERHPGLPADLDLLGEQVEALHATGIRAPIYVSIGWDEYAANHHQEWVALSPDLRQTRWPQTIDAYHAGWQCMDLASPYQDYVAGQIEAVLECFAPVDGMFLDICFDVISASGYVRAAMRRLGLDPADADHRARFARNLVHGYMERFSGMIEPALVKGTKTGVWFNSRPKAGLRSERRFLHHVEVEALPTGGWGYNYLPYVARLVRPLGLPSLGMTGRFHRSWGDMGSLKPEAAMRYECNQMLLHGLATSIGDLLSPSAVLNPGAYELIGKAFSHLKDCEPHVQEGRHLSDVALLVDPELGDDPGPDAIGVVRCLQQLRQQFDILPFDATFDGYSVVVVPATTPIGPELADRLRRHVARGGGVLIAASEDLGPEGEALLASFGIGGYECAPYSTVFISHRSEKLLKRSIGTDIRVHGNSARRAALEGTEVLAETVDPYFERTYEHFSGHSYTPPARPSGFGAILRHGAVITFQVPIFEAIAQEGNVEYREFVDACLALLLERPLLRCSGPVHLETSVVETVNGTAVHLLSYLPSRLGDDLDLVFDPFPLLDIEMQLRLEAPPARVLQQPAGKTLEVDWREGYAHTTLSVLDGHAIVVFEAPT